MVEQEENKDKVLILIREIWEFFFEKQKVKCENEDGVFMRKQGGKFFL